MVRWEIANAFHKSGRDRVTARDEQNARFRMDVVQEDHPDLNGAQRNLANLGLGGLVHSRRRQGFEHLLVVAAPRAECSQCLRWRESLVLERVILEDDAKDPGTDR